jgi:lysophospholipase L1-like esterase
MKKHSFYASTTEKNISPDRIPCTQFKNIYMPDYPIFVGANGFLPDSYRYRLYSGTINSHGYRGPGDFEIEKPRGTYRIGCFGTGVTFGEGVDDDHTYCKVLQDMLSSDFPRRRIEVLNLGIPCQTTPRLAKLFLENHRKLDCDLTVVMAGVNDSLPMFNVSQDEYGAALDLLFSTMCSEGLQVMAPLEPVNTFYPWPEHCRRYKAVLMEKLERHGIPTIDLPALLDGYERSDGLRLEEGFCLQSLVRYSHGRRQVLRRAFHIPGFGEKYISQDLYRYLDTHKVFLRTFITDVHLNEDGHRIVAAELRRVIHERWRITGKGPK